jgi:imidazolonepropionase
MQSSIKGPRRGPSLSEIGLIKNAAVLCIGGKIVSVGTAGHAARDLWIKKNRRQLTEVDCGEGVALPGFVDSHTHPAFMEPRLVDFEKRILGATYEEIAHSGGGIRSSIQGVREASRAGLTTRISDALRNLAEHGTTTVEAKSGYGLSVKSELKSLQAVAAAAKQWPGTVIPTLLGAHVTPPEYRARPQQYVDLICNEMIPAAATKKLARFVDVFCERAAFSLRDSEQIFTAAREYGLGIRAHVGQLSETRLASFLRFDPASLDHMDHINDDDLPALAASKTIATLVPGANYFLGSKNYPPARKLIESGVAIALATDYNPGTSPMISMPMAMSLACTHMNMSPAEAITASTINGAYALRIADRKGSIEAGKDADISLFNVRDYREIPYWFGMNRCVKTIIGGVANR